MTTSRLRRINLYVGLGILIVLPASGQDARFLQRRWPTTWELARFPGPAAADPESPDRTLLRAVYGLGQPFSGVMRVADFSSWPLFVAAAPGAWVYAGLSRERGGSRFALSLTLAEGSAIGAALILKRVVNRQRPYATMPTIESRSRSHRGVRVRDPYSFPSGHAAMSFSIATAVAIESGEWYIVLPAMAWAASVTLSRVWLGVHYPSDVLVGAVLGALAAWAAQELATEIVGDPNGGGNEQSLSFSIVRLSL